MRRRAMASSMEIEGTIRHSVYYPDMVNKIITRYGYGYGKMKAPLPFEGNINLVGFPSVGNGKVAYISTGNIGESICVRLYLDNYKDTYWCAVLSDNNDNKGYASEYMWD